ncbi:MAG: HDOD domain-containing protein [Pseudomonadota bacterium]
MLTAQELIEELCVAIREESIVLPSMPELAQKVRVAVDNESSTVAEVAKLIQTDVAMTARLVQIANSPLYRGVTPADNCRAVVNRLGLNVTRNLVTVFALRRVFSSADPTLLRRVQHLWEHSAMIAAVSAVLARLTPGLDSERALLAGLVHDVGEIPILNYLHNHKLLQAAGIDALIAAARGPVGREVLLAWRFDAALVDVTLYAEDTTRETPHAADYIDVVAAAHWRVNGGIAGENAPPVARKFTLFALGEDAGRELLADAQLDILELKSMLNY